MSMSLTDPEMWFKIAMPYCFQKLEVPKLKHVWLPLNRNYKPLGYRGYDRVRYEDYLEQAMKFRTNPQLFPRIWWDNMGDPENRLWLYDDDPKSRERYFARFKRLVVRAKVIDAQRLEEINRAPQLRVV